MKSLGFIEVSGVVAAVNALDTMVKTADVEFVTWERKLGGRLVTIVVQGDVSAVTQAVETAAAQCISAKPAIHAVIARPHEETIKMVELSASRMKNQEQIQ
jgi:ethanolamine utilization protein EutM